MNLFDVTRLSNYPEHSGVYLMKDDRGVVLYVGKAKNLKFRLKQYYSSGSSDDRVQIPALLSKVVDIETVLTLSEKEALLLESTLIKRFKPRYNVLLKDDRSRLLLRIDLQQEWPGIEFVRTKESSDLSPKLFGPYVGHRAAQELLDLVVRLFLLRQCTNDEFRRRTSPCLLYQMRRCSAPCVGKVSKEEYASQVASSLDFLSGKTALLRASLRKEMEVASGSLEFEKAARLFRALRLLDTVSEVRHGHSVAGASDTDVIGSYQDGDRLALAILHYRGSTLVYGESWAFELEKEMLDAEYQEQLLVQYYLRRSVIDGIPKEILVPDGHWSLEPLEALVKDHFGRAVKLRRPEGRAKKALIELAIDNARARLSQSPDSQGYTLHILESIQSLLSLKRFPRVIDCFDASHFGGKGLVASSVGFVDGKKAKGRYRTFRIRSVTVGDDRAMLQEAVRRRYREKEVVGADELPDLILIDGGPEQLSAALEALDELSLTDVDVIAIAKEHGRHDKGMTAEVVFSPGCPPLHLEITSRELLLLQAFRDEAHRFTVGFQRRRRSKEAFSSQLEGISGIGPQKKRALLMAFSGVEAIRRASPEEIHAAAGLSLIEARRVLQTLRKDSGFEANLSPKSRLRQEVLGEE